MGDWGLCWIGWQIRVGSSSNFLFSLWKFIRYLLGLLSPLKFKSVMPKHYWKAFEGMATAIPATDALGRGMVELSWRVNWLPCELKSWEKGRGKSSIRNAFEKGSNLVRILDSKYIFTDFLHLFLHFPFFWGWALFSKTALGNVTPLLFCCLSSNILSLMFLLFWLEHKMTLLPKIDWFKSPILHDFVYEQKTLIKVINFNLVLHCYFSLIKVKFCCIVTI